MERDEMDFTANFELRLRSNFQGDSTPSSSVIWCYGIVLWFETGFTSRFCKEMPTVLSTSPYSPRTHWSQTILTFCEPIVMQSDKSIPDSAASVGTEGCPAVRIRSRISIVRSPAHRSIDISMETVGISSDGRKCSWPVQIFNMWEDPMDPCGCSSVTVFSNLKLVYFSVTMCLLL